MSTPTRADFTAALNGAGIGLAASDYRPEPGGEGNAWAQPGSWDNPGGQPNGVFEATWLVFIIVPQDEQAAAVWWDEHAATVSGALLPLVFIDRVEPVVFETQAGDLFAVQITGRSE